MGHTNAIKRAYSKFGKLVQLKLFEKGMTQKQLAEKLGITQSCITQVMYTDHRAKEARYKIAKELDIDLEKTINIWEPKTNQQIIDIICWLTDHDIIKNVELVDDIMNNAIQAYINYNKFKTLINKIDDKPFNTNFIVTEDAIKQEINYGS